MSHPLVSQLKALTSQIAELLDHPAHLDPAEHMCQVAFGLSQLTHTLTHPNARNHPLRLATNMTQLAAQLAQLAATLALLLHNSADHPAELLTVDPVTPFPTSSHHSSTPPSLFYSPETTEPVSNNPTEALPVQPLNRSVSLPSESKSEQPSLPKDGLLPVADLLESSPEVAEPSPPLENPIEPSSVAAESSPPPAMTESVPLPSSVATESSSSFVMAEPSPPFVLLTESVPPPSAVAIDPHVTSTLEHVLHSVCGATVHPPLKKILIRSKRA